MILLTIRLGSTDATPYQTLSVKKYSQKAIDSLNCPLSRICAVIGLMQGARGTVEKLLATNVVLAVVVSNRESMMLVEVIQSRLCFFLAIPS
jgi:hypothetical protein